MKQLYTGTSYDMSKLLTRRYSTSFSFASRMFTREHQRHVYAIYGLVRIADEIVDTYCGEDMRQLLDALRKNTYAAIKREYSPNPVIHAFAHTARAVGIDAALIDPFFDSMAMDILKKTYNETEYASYIHGSAEVIGLMCLKVFLDGDDARYDELKTGAKHLGAAYQKVNFLRDVRADHSLGRWYFPNCSYDTFDEIAKQAIIDDIKRDFDNALPAIAKLPTDARKAVRLSYAYYYELLKRIEMSPIHIIKSSRIRVPNKHKLSLMAKNYLTKGR